LRITDANTEIFALLRPWASAEIFPGRQRRHFAYPLQVAGDAVEVDVHKTLYPLLNTTKKMLHVTATVTKRVSWAAIARQALITIIYTIGYLQIFKARHFFSMNHYH